MAQLASEELRKIVKSVIRNAPPLRNPERDENRARSDTAVLAFEYCDGVIMAADRRMTIGDDIASDTVRKISQISRYSVIGDSGVVAVIQLITESFQKTLTAFRFKTHDDIPIANQIKILKNILREASFILGNIESEFLLGGFDLSKNRAVIVKLEGFLGGVIPQKVFGAIGSGGDKSITTLRNYFCIDKRAPKETSREDAIMLAIKGIAAASQEIHVSPPQISPPGIVCVDKNGVVFLADEAVQEFKRRMPS
ncbi:MAG: hypothetical protein HY456_00495 [Parcubacteria group bacterium]|nr:hypothetical protein [Parcubacteria group bacterium]